MGSTALGVIRECELDGLVKVTDASRSFDGCQNRCG